MKKKIFDYAILTGCLTIVILFFANGIFGFGGGTTKAGASDATATPINNWATPTPTPKAVRLVAGYSGTSVTVGEEYDKDKLSVIAYYDYGEPKELKPSEYTVSSDIVYKNGMNTIIVVYRDLTTMTYVYGRSLVGISVSPLKYEYGIGNMPDKRDLNVTGLYSDGSIKTITDDYVIYPQKLETLGSQEISVYYQGKEAKCRVSARDWTSVAAIAVTCNKPEIVTNIPLSKDDFTVMVVYTDLTAERVSTFTMSRNVFYDSGKQPITISYGGVSKTINLNVTERYVTGVRAEYTGGDVLVGRKFRRENMHVYIKYVDGEEEETEYYTVDNSTIRYVGKNTITVYYGDKLSSQVTIEGTAYQNPNFDYVSSDLVTNGKVVVKVDTAVPWYIEEDCTTLAAVPDKNVKKAYRKLKLKSGSYIAFNYGFENFNDELEMPLSVRVTIPDEYDIEHTYLYYCPNNKTVLGCIDRKIVSSKTFECSLFKTGTYMLVYSDELAGIE